MIGLVIDCGNFSDLFAEYKFSMMYQSVRGGIGGTVPVFRQLHLTSQTIVVYETWFCLDGTSLRGYVIQFVSQRVGRISGQNWCFKAPFLVRGKHIQVSIITRVPSTEWLTCCDNRNQDDAQWRKTIDYLVEQCLIADAKNVRDLCFHHQIGWYWFCLDVMKCKSNSFCFTNDLVIV